jgi:hypothetical protein
MAEFTARYPGACAYGDRIHEGDLCRYVDDEIAHVECALADGPTNVVAAETVCPECQLAHRGDCF